MATASVKLMLLGIGVLLFGVIFPSTLEPLLLRLFFHSIRPITEYLIASIAPLVGLVLLLVGFFRNAA